MPYYVTVESKVCSDCGLEKPAIEFSKQPGNRDGLIRRCKSCERIFRERYKGRYGRSSRTTELVDSPV